MVFAAGPSAEAAIEAGADEVGGEEITAKVPGGYIGLDVAVSTPVLMPRWERLVKFSVLEDSNAETADRAMEQIEAAGGSVTLRQLLQRHLLVIRWWWEVAFLALAR